MSSDKYNDIVVEVTGKIGIIKLNRPKTLNAFGGKLIEETIAALRELDEHPSTVFTVLTGEGRFFSAGADIRAAELSSNKQYSNIAEKKLSFLAGCVDALEILRSVIDHKKVFVLGLNGPAVGGGAAWFAGVADIVLASTSTYMQVPFSALGLVPEYGSALNFAQSMGIHRANDFLMFGRKLSINELEQWGLVNRVLPAEGYQGSLKNFLEDQLDANDGKSMMEMKRLQNAHLRDRRILAVYNAMDALAERFVADVPQKRFAKKKELLESKSKSRRSKI
ncbi:hypothetical protein V496_07660 [Pseudogymnoascus sp. VKM F-4515 (FW-2607)]|nr:hypothetical protein V496_07660 [Pseudogymnoascus sp. VKM F-4515 (FW-2607)]